MPKTVNDLVINQEMIVKISNIGKALARLTAEEKELLKLFAHSDQKELNDFLDRAVAMEAALSGLLGKVLYE